ncbi:NADH-quinone oxidoreductase subunit C [Acidobacteriia bacterium AH_259_A11_L15]|nr:NADH-quinone oxidoreductase subunit C [Acidobacteriia bacterium AH_259_A11_L15]
MTCPSELADRLVIRKLQSFHPRALQAASEFRGQLIGVVSAALIRDICDFLRSDPELRFDFLVDLTAVDRYPVEPRFEIVYLLRSMKTGQRLCLKAPLTGKDPRIDSLVPLWPAADMLEREVFDLFGVHFTGHPGLRRIQMPDDWQGHPLRKDYPLEGDR